MIRKFSITIKKFVRAYLPMHKRQTNRLKLFADVLTYPFTLMMAEFKAWRDEAIIKATVTIEKTSIEWYLNRQFDPVLQRIYINTNNAEGVIMGNRATEPDDFQLMGNRATEPDDYVIFSNRGEHPAIGYASFGVYIPSALSSSKEAIAALMRVYKLAGKSFVIIEF